MPKILKSRKVLTVFTLAMINVAIIVSLRGLPMMAEYGLSSICFYMIAAIVFLIPVALVSAELATGWPQTGGVFVWVSEAFGERWGFLATWLQWIQNVVWYPTVLSFVAATISYIFNPALASNKLYNLFIILVFYWGATLINFKGMKVSGWMSTFCVIAGTLIPGVLIIVLGFLYFVGGNPSEIVFSWGHLIPDFTNVKNIVFLAGVIVLFAGMEVSAVHAQEVKNPQKDYPKSIFLATIITLVIFILGSLSIAIVVPSSKISLTAGLLQAFDHFFAAFHISWLLPVIAILIAIGALGQVSSWIAGPSKGLFAIAKKGNLPPMFQKTNKNGMAVVLLTTQGCIVSVLALVFLFMPTVSSSYWILTALTAQLYLIMYVLLYAAAIYLRYSRPNVKRAYRVPGGNLGMWITGGIGIIGALFVLTIGFFPPSQFQLTNPIYYVLFLIIGIVFLGGIPLLIYQFKKPSWMHISEVKKTVVKKDPVKKTAAKKVAPKRKK